VSSLGISVQAAGFILLNPNADQLPREIVPLGEPIKGLPTNVLLHHLPLKLDAVRTLLSGHGFHLSKAQHTCQITNFHLSVSRLAECRQWWKPRYDRTCRLDCAIYSAI